MQATVHGFAKSRTRLSDFTSLQTIVEVMEVMWTSFERSHASNGAVSAPNPEASHHRPTPPPQSPGHSWACLGQSLVGSILLSSGSWCTAAFVFALLQSVSQSCVSSGGSVVG